MNDYLKAVEPTKISTPSNSATAHQCTSALIRTGNFKSGITAGVVMSAQVCKQSCCVCVV